MRYLSLLVLLNTAAAVFTFAAAEPAQDVRPVRVLILTGANNHDWQATTPELKKLFGGSPRFKVLEVLADPSKISTEKLAGCDVVVSNWSAFPAMTGHQWGADAEKAFVDWMRAGHGFVVFHAASATSQDWPEFQQLVGLTWGLDKTGHGVYSTFKVTVSEQSHPITAGLTDFWITDELWHKMVSIGEPQYQVLCKAFSSQQWSGSNRFEPALICTSLEKGRGVNLILGHDVHAMQNPGWRTLMLRSAEWAATGRVTLSVPSDWPHTAAAAAVVGVDLDAVMKGVAGYRLGQPRRDLLLLEQLVNHATSLTGDAGAAARKRLSEKMTAVLADDAPPEAKVFICSQICLVGSAEQAPVIAPLLADEALSNAARYALERMPFAEARRTLRDALGRSGGKIRIGIINSLGNLHDTESTAALTVLQSDSDAVTADAATAALARIRGEKDN